MLDEGVGGGREEGSLGRAHLSPNIGYGGEDPGSFKCTFGSFVLLVFYMERKHIFNSLFY